MNITTFDCDGVLTLPIYIRPGDNDIIITGRSFEEESETLEFLAHRSIYNKVLFNPLRFEEKTRKSSGQHKGNTIKRLAEEGYTIDYHVEDDPVQVEEILKIVPWLKIIRIDHGGIINMENTRRNSLGNDL